MSLQISFSRLLKSGVKYFLLFALPVIAQQLIRLYPDLAGMSISEAINYLLSMIYPGLSSLTFGAIIVMIVKYAKVKAEIMGRIKEHNEK